MEHPSKEERRYSNQWLYWSLGCFGAFFVSLILLEAYESQLKSVKILGLFVMVWFLVALLAASILGCIGLKKLFQKDWRVWLAMIAWAVPVGMGLVYFTIFALVFLCHPKQILEKYIDVDPPAEETVNPND